LAANRHVQNFLELRSVLEGVVEGGLAALAFMDENGIAIRARKGRPAADSSSPTPKAIKKNLDALRAKVKHRYKATRHAKTTNGNGRGSGTEPADDNMLTASEAAKFLKMSDANVRFMWGDGRLPKPTKVERYSKKLKRTMTVQAIPKDAAQRYLDESKPAE
jgi:hypothetical protein